MDTIMEKVAIVIPTHNNKRTIIECLEFIMKDDYDNIEIIVIDDGSWDGTTNAITAEYPSVKVINGDGNLWWAGAMNVGIKAALDGGADYVLALNDDVLISPGSVRALVTCAQAHGKTIIGSLIYFAQDSNIIWSAGGLLKWPWPGEFMVGR